MNPVYFPNVTTPHEFMKKYFWTFYTFGHQDIETLNEMTNVLQNTFTNACFLY